ncbi:hypothetical protein [Nitratireductor sp. ZSWI3]|uniref:hypothetical protein n=1 Tax=Nitratireductor sp. ZSWI3 TaxID=2966359 RepID=UPI00215064C5|nr:hypothetical protein [Nitratireductor sp. ZSWI3]MCR4265340.1 hypothetical protein [Nitratireductor sp. ZSWI3]
MLYRLYRRDPVKKGSWYYAVTCKGCDQLIYLLDDNSQGKTPVQMVGDGSLSAPCLRCAHDDLYAVSDVQVVQSTEDIMGARPLRVEISAASRKPLWKSYPRAKVTFGVGYLEDRPAAAAIIGRIVTSWADLEVQCAQLLAELMGTNIPAAAAVFGSLRSSRAQHDALSAAAESVLNDADFELFTAHMARRASLEKERNDLAHGCFGVSVAIPDHIVWVAQADYLTFSATGGDPDAFRKKQFVYELGTLERIAQEIEEFYNQLRSLIGYLWARRDDPHGAAFRAQRYPQLCSQPHIRQALDRARTTKREQKARAKARS